MPNTAIFRKLTHFLSQDILISLQNMYKGKYVTSKIGQMDFMGVTTPNVPLLV